MKKIVFWVPDHCPLAAISQAANTLGIDTLTSNPKNSIIMGFERTIKSAERAAIPPEPVIRNADIIPLPTRTPSPRRPRGGDDAA